MVTKIIKRFQYGVFLFICLTTTWLQASELTSPSLDTLIDNVAAGKDRELAMYVAVQGITDSSVDIREKSLRIFEKLFAQNEGFMLVSKFLAQNKQHPNTAIQSDLERLKDLLSTMQSQQPKQDAANINKISLPQAPLLASTPQKNDDGTLSVFTKGLLFALLGGGCGCGLALAAKIPKDEVKVWAFGVAGLAVLGYGIYTEASREESSAPTDERDDGWYKEIVAATKQNLSALEQNPLLAKNTSDEKLLSIIRASSVQYPLAVAAAFFQSIIKTGGVKQAGINQLYKTLAVESKIEDRHALAIPLQAACIILAEKITPLLASARTRLEIIKAHKDYQTQAGFYEMQQKIAQLQEAASSLRSELYDARVQIRAARWDLLWHK